MVQLHWVHFANLMNNKVNYHNSSPKTIWNNIQRSFPYNIENYLELHNIFSLYLSFYELL